jgi:hypothetical protein
LLTTGRQNFCERKTHAKKQAAKKNQARRFPMRLIFDFSVRAYDDAAEITTDKRDSRRG